MSSLAKFFGRTGTRSKYGKTPERKLPTEKEPATEIHDDDDTADKKDTERTEEEIKASQDRKETEKSGFKPERRGKTVIKGNIASDRAGTSSSVTPNDFFNRFWSTVITHHLHSVTYTDNVWFVPNALPLFTISSIFFELVGRSNWIEKHETTFMPYAASTAICYLYYIQILRAKEAAGALIGEETSILTRFRKCFPEEKIDIPGVFVPYFESIVATEPSDNKYPWIVPHYGDLTNLTGMDRFHSDPFLNFMRPMIPLMLSNIATFAAIRPANINNSVDDEGIFHPVNLHPAANANAVRCFNQNFDFTAAAPPAAAAAMTNNMRVFHTGGMTIPFQFYNDNVAAVHKHLRRTNFVGAIGIDTASTAGMLMPNGGNLLETRSFATLENFLYLQKSKSGHWADYIFKQLSIAAKHSTGNKNLSEIATTGGMESTIFCSLRTYQAHNHNGANHYTYADPSVGLTDSSHVRWFRNDLFRDLTGRFETSRADVERNEELQAFVFGINAVLPIHQATRNVSGSFFTQATNAGGVDEAMLYSEHGERDTTVRGPVQMYSGWEQNVIRPGFLNKPAGM
nr:capsid protein [Hebeloma mesophaeum partitivirus 1]